MTMTDLEKFIDTYKQFGIEIKTYENTKGNIEITLNGWEETATKSDKFDGYSEFVSDLEFTKEGKFLRQGFWE
jgi:hypothetical protein